MQEFDNPVFLPTLALLQNIFSWNSKGVLLYYISSALNMYVYCCLAETFSGKA